MNGRKRNEAMSFLGSNQKTESVKAKCGPKHNHIHTQFDTAYGYFEFYIGHKLEWSCRFMGLPRCQGKSPLGLWVMPDPYVRGSGVGLQAPVADWVSNYTYGTNSSTSNSILPSQMP